MLAMWIVAGHTAFLIATVGVRRRDRVAHKRNAMGPGAAQHLHYLLIGKRHGYEKDYYLTPASRRA